MPFDNNDVTDAVIYLGDGDNEPDKTWHYVGGVLGAILLVLIIVVVVLVASSRGNKDANNFPDYMQATVNGQAYVRVFYFLLLFFSSFFPPFFFTVDDCLYIDSCALLTNLLSDSFCLVSFFLSFFGAG